MYIHLYLSLFIAVFLTIFPNSECELQVDSIMKRLALQLFIENEINLVVSPLLIRFTMCKLATISKGQAKTELLAALGLRADFQLEKCFSVMKENMETMTKFNVIWKNVLFVKYLDLNGNFTKNSLTETGVEVQKVGFDLPKAATRFINSAIASQSLHRITQVIDDGDLDKNTTMVLVNAVYLRTYWESPFTPKWTAHANFYKLNKKTVSVPMMGKIDNMVWYLEDKELDLKAAEIRLAIYGVCMLIVVPNNPQGLPGLIQKMSKDPGFLDTLRSKLKIELVKVLLPRFKIKTYVSWGDFLGQVGVNEIFNPETADLSEMLKGKDGVHLDKVKQSVFIEIDEGGLPNYDQEKEDGYEDIINQRWSIKPFIADRPFYFNFNLRNHETPVISDFLTGVYYGPEK